MVEQQRTHAPKDTIVSNCKLCDCRCVIAKQKFKLVHAQLRICTLVCAFSFVQYSILFSCRVFRLLSVPDLLLNTERRYKSASSSILLVSISNSECRRTPQFFFFSLGADCMANLNPAKKKSSTNWKKGGGGGRGAITFTFKHGQRKTHRSQFVFVCWNCQPHRNSYL